jgi:hypothetical protein
MSEGRPAIGARLLRSLRVQVLALLAILVALPVLLYAIFADAQERQRELLVAAVRDAGTAIAAGMAPTLRDLEPEKFDQLQGQLDRFADPRRGIVLLFHPDIESADTAFFLVASEPALAVEQLDQERQRLGSLGVLPALARSCTGGTPMAERVALGTGGAAMITSITGVAAKAGCWAIVIAVRSERVLAGIDDRPFYARPELQLALFVYGVMAGLILLICGAFAAWRWRRPPPAASPLRPWFPRSCRSPARSIPWYSVCAAPQTCCDRRRRTMRTRSRDRLQPSGMRSSR